MLLGLDFAVVEYVVIVVVMASVAVALELDFAAAVELVVVAAELVVVAAELVDVAGGGCWGCCDWPACCCWGGDCGTG